MASRVDRRLERLAWLYGVQTSFVDVFARRRRASPDSVRAVLRAFGAPLGPRGQVLSALRHRTRELWQRWTEPVVVAWDGRLQALEVRLPERLSRQAIACHLHEEEGASRTWIMPPSALVRRARVTMDGRRYVRARLAIPHRRLALGYHRMRLEIHGRSCEALIVAAPRQAYAPAQTRRLARSWGAFVPLYALRSASDWGIGDLADLKAFGQWIHRMGGDTVATLPLLAAFLENPCEPSPYSPVSRLAWNEIYTSIPQIPEMAACPAARAAMRRADFGAELEALRDSPLVEYRRVMALKRGVLERLARQFFTHPQPSRAAAFQRFVRAHPHVEAYATFRAVQERRRTGWPVWPARLRQGTVGRGDYEDSAQQYHLYAQWIMQEQLQRVANGRGADRTGLYLDFPLGVHADGFDVWREQAAFASGLCGGAPPDAVFTGGQNWGFPPLHPDGIRAQGYRYYVACLRHHLQLARALRLDHVMSLHRLFVMPCQASASEGVYVRYRPEEFYAILALESRRAKAIIVGENLGTVPPEVNPTMRAHRIHRMFVVEYELATKRRPLLPPVAADCVASLNTHDMPPFAASWRGLDIEQRASLRLLDEAGVRRERQMRQVVKEALCAFLRRQGVLDETPGDLSETLKACLAWLGASRARLVIANLEDLWGEIRSQNVPGTSWDQPNWRLKTRYRLETFRRLPEVRRILLTLHRQRKGRRS